MKTAFKNFTNSVIWLSILAIILGLIMLFYPGISLVSLGIVAGVYLIIHGITLIIMDIKAWRLYIPFEGMLLGILCVLLGILLVMYPAGIAIYIGTVIGLWIIISSFNYIKLAASLKGTDAPWVLIIILSIIDIIIGVIALFFPGEASVTVTMWIGIFIIVHAIISIVNMITAKKDAKALNKIIMEKIDPAK
ncbi:MAG: DUF308 domain-containing protein [Clostridia bacterium]|nr:DUF308 domain-containing protein [Clostridia bacterium]